MDTVHIWHVAQGATAGTLWVAMRNYERWLPSWKQRFHEQYGEPEQLNRTCRGTQVIEVPKYAAMRANWFYIIGEKGLRQNPPESMLEGLTPMKPVCELAEVAFYEPTCSETASCPTGPTISVIDIGDD